MIVEEEAARIVTVKPQAPQQVPAAKAVKKLPQESTCGVSATAPKMEVAASVPAPQKMRNRNAAVSVGGNISSASMRSIGEVERVSRPVVKHEDFQVTTTRPGAKLGTVPVKEEGRLETHPAPAAPLPLSFKEEGLVKQPCQELTIYLQNPDLPQEVACTTMVVYEGSAQGPTDRLLDPIISPAKDTIISPAMMAASPRVPPTASPALTKSVGDAFKMDLSSATVKASPAILSANSKRSKIATEKPVIICFVEVNHRVKCTVSNGYGALEASRMATDKHIEQVLWTGKTGEAPMGSPEVMVNTKAWLDGYAKMSGRRFEDRTDPSFTFDTSLTFVITVDVCEDPSNKVSRFLNIQVDTVGGSLDALRPVISDEMLLPGGNISVDTENRMISARGIPLSHANTILNAVHKVGYVMRTHTIEHPLLQMVTPASA